MTDKKDVEAMIYNLSGEILMGKATKEKIKEVTELATKHGLLKLLSSELEKITATLTS